MTKTILRPALGLLLLALPALASAGSGTALNETKPAKRGGVVSIENISGSVTVSTWSRSEIEVTGTLGAGSERLDFEVDGSRAEIAVVLPRGRNSHVKSSDLIVRVPQGSALEISVVSATVDVTADSKVEIECVSGDVTVAGSATEVEVDVVSGDVTVRLAGELSRADIETVSGKIELSSRLEPDGRLRIESVSGDVELHLQDGLAASFELQTFSGSLRNKLTSDRPESGFGPGSELSFSTGGNARVRVETFSGDVLLDSAR